MHTRAKLPEIIGDTAGKEWIMVLFETKRYNPTVAAKNLA